MHLAFLLFCHASSTPLDRAEHALAASEFERAAQLSEGLLANGTLDKEGNARAQRIAALAQFYLGDKTVSSESRRHSIRCPSMARRHGPAAVSSPRSSALGARHGAHEQWTSSLLRRHSRPGCPSIPVTPTTSERSDCRRSIKPRSTCA